LQAPHKAINLPGGIHDALLAGKERMAMRTKIGSDLFAFPGRTSLPACATGSADYRYHMVIGMNTRFHDLKTSLILLI